MSAVTVWREVRRKYRVSEKKTRSGEFLVSDHAPGLMVKAALWANLKAEEPEFVSLYGGKIFVENTGCFIGPAFVGIDRPCELAVKLSALFDFTAVQDVRIKFDDAVLAQIQQLFNSAVAEDEIERPAAIAAEKARREKEWESLSKVHP